MRCLKMIAVILVPLMLSLTGCGSDSSGTTSANNPFTTSGGNTSSGSGGTIFGNISTATGSTGITLTTDRATVDVNNGQVLATATLVNAGVAIAGAPVTFSIEAPTNGPATIEAGLTTVATDSNGVATTRITTGNSLTTTNVIVKASATIGGQTAFAYATFQIVRGTGVITFPGTPISREKTVDPGIGSWIFFEQIPFTVTDSNGNPRVGVPVTLSVYSHASNALLQSGLPSSVVIIDYLLGNPLPELNQQTVTSDSAGKGVFNMSVEVLSPGPGLNTVDSIVFKAATNDPIPLVSYAGLITNLIEALPKLIITPQSANFATTDITGTTISFTVSGGVPPYQVTSSSPARVSVTLQPDGTTAIATLQDASLWEGSVSISATDQKNQIATATVLRQ